MEKKLMKRQNIRNDGRERWSFWLKKSFYIFGINMIGTYIWYNPNRWFLEMNMLKFKHNIKLFLYPLIFK